LTGALKLGRLVQFVPQPVIAGFTAGVGGVISFSLLLLFSLLFIIIIVVIVIVYCYYI